LCTYVTIHSANRHKKKFILYNYITVHGADILKIQNNGNINRRNKRHDVTNET